MFRAENDGPMVEIRGSIHENGSVDNCPVNVEDNRVINPDQRIMNPVIVNFHLHINEIPQDTNGFVKKIIGGLINALNPGRNTKIDDIQGLSAEDIQGRIVRQIENR